MTLTSFIAFIGVCVALSITPGPDTLLSLRYALVSRRTGIAAAAGSASGMLVWAALAVFGLAALFETSDLAYYVVSLLGGGYISFLGVRTLLGGLRRMRLSPAVNQAMHTAAVGNGGVRTSSSPDFPRGEVSSTGPVTQKQSTTAHTPSRTMRAAFFAGVVTCVTNPKVGLFFLALFPQFTPGEAHPMFSVLVLGGTATAVGFIYLGGLSLVVDAANRWLANPKVTGWVEIISAALLIGIGTWMLVIGALALAG